MLAIRKAQDKDSEAVLRILKAHDIYYSALQFKGFWVAEDDGRVVGCAQLEEHPNFYYLGSVAVDTGFTRSGIAKKMLNSILADLKKDVYLYTIVPEFFRKFGFTETPPRAALPSKERYDCEGCYPEKCVCMVVRAKG